MPMIASPCEELSVYVCLERKIVMLGMKQCGLQSSGVLDYNQAFDFALNIIEALHEAQNEARDN